MPLSPRGIASTLVCSPASTNHIFARLFGPRTFSLRALLSGGSLVNLGELTGSRGLFESLNCLPADVQPTRDIDYFKPAALAPPPHRRRSHANLFSPGVKRDQ